MDCTWLIGDDRVDDPNMIWNLESGIQILDKGVNL